MGLRVKEMEKRDFVIESFQSLIPLEISKGLEVSEWSKILENALGWGLGQRREMERNQIFVLTFVSGIDGRKKGGSSKSCACARLLTFCL